MLPETLACTVAVAGGAALLLLGVDGGNPLDGSRPLRTILGDAAHAWGARLRPPLMWRPARPRLSFRRPKPVTLRPTDGGFHPAV
jgi:hypothetical protein